MKDVIKIFRRYLPPYKKLISVNILFNFLGALFGIFSFITMIPILKILFRLDDKAYVYQKIDFSLKNIIEWSDALTNNLYAYIQDVADKYSETRVLVYLGIFLIVMVFFKTGFTYLASFYLAFIRNGVIRDVRNQIFDKTINLPMSYFSDEKKGDIIARMTGDILEIETSIISSLEMLFKNPIIILLSVITMILFSWQLTLFVFIFFPITGLIIGLIGRSLRRPSKLGQNKLGEILSTIEESLSGLRIIKAFNAERKMQSKFSGQNEEFKRIMNGVIQKRSLATPISEFLGTVVIIVVMWFGGSLILNEVNGISSTSFFGKIFIGKSATLDPEVFLVYLVVFYSIINPAKAFSQAYYNVQKGLASMDRVDKILNTISKIKEPELPQSLKELKESIEYKNVSFKYNRDFVLKNINLKIKKGKSIALVGQSGSGKTTLVDLLPRFYDVSEGEILIDNKNIKNTSIKDLRNLFGIVNQEPILFNDSFLNNIAFGVDGVQEQDVINAAKVANAHEFIMETEDGYFSNIGDRGGKLSGGQRQRISIARAVLKNPPILILDEATSSLDTESERLVQDALNKLMKNRTSIIIAHRLSTIIHADEICVLSNGEIVERGTHKELLAANGEYKKFYELQNFS